MSSFVLRLRATAGGARARLQLTTRGLLALGAALCTTLAVTGLFAVVTEDVTQHNGLSSTDPSHLRLFVEHRPSALVSAAKVVTEIGAAPVLLLIALVIAGVLWWRGARFVVAVSPMVSLLIAGALASAGKQIVGRTRPPAALRLVNETNPSFPSGHATDAAAVFLTIGLVISVFVLRRPIARACSVAAGALLGVAVALSRLVLGVHWPTDVIAGWALGTIVALTITVTAALATHLTPPAAPEHAHRVRRLISSAVTARRAGYRPNVSAA